MNCHVTPVEAHLSPFIFTPRREPEGEVQQDHFGGATPDGVPDARDAAGDGEGVQEETRGGGGEDEGGGKAQADNRDLRSDRGGGGRPEGKRSSVKNSSKLKKKKEFV